MAEIIPFPKRKAEPPAETGTDFSTFLAKESAAALERYRGDSQLTDVMPGIRTIANLFTGES